MERLLFAYPLPEGSRVAGFDAREVQAVMAVCTPDAEEGCVMSYTLVSESLGVLPSDDFDDSGLPRHLCVEGIELAIRARIEDKLRSHTAGSLERSTAHAVLEYAFCPDCPRGAPQRDTRVKVECYWPRQGVYFVVLRLMRGKTDLGVVGARRLRGAAISMEELAIRVQFMAEALLPDNFNALADALLRKYAKENGDD